MRYADGFLTFQQYRDSNMQKLTDPETLEMPERRWESLSTDFIVILPKTRDGYDSINTWVDRFFRRAHFIRSKRTDMTVDLADSFFENTFKHHRLPGSIVSDRDCKFRSAS